MPTDDARQADGSGGSPSDDEILRDLLARVSERALLLDDEDRVRVATTALDACSHERPLRGRPVAQVVAEGSRAALDDLLQAREPNVVLEIPPVGTWRARLERLGSQRVVVLAPMAGADVGQPWARELADAMPQLVWMAGPSGRVEYYNRRHEEYAGIHLHDDGWRWEPVVHPDDLDATVQAWERAVATGTPYEMEHRVQRADGCFEWHVSRGVPVRDASGRVVRWFGTATNVDALKRAQERAAEQHALVEAVLDGVRDLVFVKDRQGRYIVVNQAAARLVGLPSQEVLGKRDADLFPPDFQAAALAQDEAVLAAGTWTEREQRIRGPAGEERVFEVAKGPLRDAHGQVTGVIGVSREVTDARRAERAVRESEERLREALVKGRSFAFQWTPDDDAVVRSPECGVIMGLEGDEAVHDTGVRFFQRLHPDDRVPFRQLLASLTPEDSSYTTVYRLVRGDGSIVELEERGRAVFQDGRLVRLSGITSDITDRRRAERELLASEERFRIATEAMSGVVYEWEVGTGRVSRSGGLFALTGFRPHEVPSDLAWWQERVHTEDLQRIEGERDEAIARRAPLFATEYRLLHRDGRSVWVWDQGRVTYDAEGRPVRVVGCTVDVDARHRAEDALREADRRKDEFIALLGHELRNPLAPIRTAVELLEHLDGLPPTVHRVREVVARQVGQMASLVDDLLDVSRVSRGKVELRREPCDLARIVSDVAEDHRGSIEAGGLTLAVVRPSEPATIVADPTRVAQIVGNLLDNAAKFTDAGGRVSLSVVADDEAAELRVEDTGVGMEPEMLERIFQPFAQADRTLDRRKGGLGLGLALVKGLVELHGGSVGAESPGLGKGTRIRVRFPLAAPPARRPSAPALQAPRRGLRVLVIEDNVDGAEMLSMLLTARGHDVEVAYDGEEGLARAKARHPEVVLCDVGLPGMSGLDVARAMRSDPELRHARLVAQTGYGRAEDVEDALSAGFDAHLRKPIDLDRLTELLADAARDA
jgi:PAS domain S-box-containing protein